MGHGVKFIDACQNYKETMAVTQINIGIRREGECDTGKEKCEIWYFHNIAKDYGGWSQWSPALKQWLSISVEALPNLCRTLPRSNKVDVQRVVVQRE
eukprot:154970-Rhodomonas_salina.2